MHLHAAYAAPESRGLRELSSQQFQVEVVVVWQLQAEMEGDDQVEIEEAWWFLTRAVAGLLAFRAVAGGGVDFNPPVYLENRER